MNTHATHLTRAEINLDHLTHNMTLLQELVGARPMWPAIKANGYGHGMEIIARHLVKLGYKTLCVAHIAEAITLMESGVAANVLLLSATLPEHSEAIVSYGCEPAVCSFEMIEALVLSRTAMMNGKPCDNTHAENNKQNSKYSAGYHQDKKVRLFMIFPLIS